MNPIVSPYRKNTEIWLPSPINGHEFLVSDQGNVLRLIWEGERIVGAVTAPFQQGIYLRVALNRGSRNFAVHLLVLEAFIGLPPNRSYQGNHKNGDKHDNRLENLEWVTRSQNVKHAIEVIKTIDTSKRAKHRLHKSTVQEIRRLLVSGLSYAEISEQTSVRVKTIVAIHQNRIYPKY